MFEVEYRTIDSTDATSRSMSLLGIPVSSNNVAVDLIGGTAQALTGDFYVDGNKIKWDTTSYNLYYQMAEKDKVRVIYDRS